MHNGIESGWKEGQIQSWKALIYNAFQLIFIFFGEHSLLHSACSDLSLAAKTSSPLYRQVLQQEFVLSSLAVIQVLVKGQSVP